MSGGRAFVVHEDLGTEQIELEGTRAIDSRHVTHLRVRPPKTPRKDGGAP